MQEMKENWVLRVVTVWFVVGCFAGITGITEDRAVKIGLTVVMLLYGGIEWFIDWRRSVAYLKASQAAYKSGADMKKWEDVYEGKDT